LGGQDTRGPDTRGRVTRPVTLPRVTRWVDGYATAGQRWTAGLCLLITGLVVAFGLPPRAALSAVVPVLAAPSAPSRQAVVPATAPPAPPAALSPPTELSGLSVQQAVPAASSASPATTVVATPSSAPPQPSRPRPPSPPPTCTTDPLVAALVAQLQALAKTLGPGAGALLAMVAKAVACG
jgi:hypothetical protein